MFATLNTLLCATLVAQSGTQTTTDHASVEATRPAYSSLADFMDAEVALEADLEARREASEDGELAEQPRADVVDVIMTRDGEIRLVALSVGGMLGIGDKIVLVPSSRLYPDLMPKSAEDKLTCSLHMTVEELKALPEFDADKVKDENLLNTTVATVEAAFPRVRGENSEKKDAEASARTTRFAMASDLMGLEVTAMGEEFGKVTDAAIDMHHHCVDYLIVSHGSTLGLGGDHYLVPLAAAQLTEKDADSNECVLKLTKTVAQLEACTKYEAPEDDNQFLLEDHCKLSNECFGTKPRKHADSK